ncbi:MAG: hypothetical protein J0L96_11955 [Anaerolineae bacterium]|nr:hypothetical protein [Anaerolineae bacterium]
MRDDFKENIKQKVAARVGFHCSNPSCRKLTSGPDSDPNRALNIGVAAHITAAAPGGPRFDSSLTAEQRSSIENAIWLCQSCGTLIDRDRLRFTVSLLREWKLQAERAASSLLAAGTEFRPIAPSELIQELTIGELATIRALSEEFGCEVTPDVRVPSGNGWINLHAAVVRREDLVAIDIHEFKGQGLPYFQIEYLVELGAKLKFERFQKFVLYIAVISDALPELDYSVQQRLEQIAEKAPFEVYIRMYRLNVLRAKYNL